MVSTPTEIDGALRTKPAPRLHQAPPGRLRMLRDFAWLVGLLMRETPGASALWAGAMIVEGLLVPAQLWLTKRLVDALAADLAGATGQRPYLWVGLLAATVIADRALEGVAPWIETKVRWAAGSAIEERTMRHAAGLDLAEFEHQGYYDQVGRVLAEPGVRGPESLARTFELLRSVPQVAGYAVALATITPLLLLLFLVSTLPAVANFVLTGQLYWSALVEQTRDRRLADYYASLLTERRFAKEIRLFGVADHVLDRWSHLYWKTRNAQRRKAGRLALRQRSPVLVSQSFMLFGLVWIASAGLDDATPGDYALLVQAIFGLSNAAFGLAYSLRVIGENTGYASDVRTFLEVPPANSNDERAGEPLLVEREIRFDDVWFTYPGSVEPAVAGISFAIRAGEKIALVGENGAGKSTLVKLLLGLYRPDSGRITVDGRDLHLIDPQAIRDATSAVLQQFVRYQMTFAENVGLGMPERIDDRSRLEAAAVSAGAHQIGTALPLGYDTLLGPDVGGVDLSGGEWQRVALARGIVRDARVLVLDEPTAALDPLAELAIFERFAELVQERTAIFISHRLGMARLADRIVVLDQGRLVEDGSHDVLLAANGHYAAMFRAQARWYE